MFPIVQTVRSVSSDGFAREVDLTHSIFSETLPVFSEGARSQWSSLDEKVVNMRKQFLPVPPNNTPLRYSHVSNRDNQSGRALERSPELREDFEGDSVILEHWNRFRAEIHSCDDAPFLHGLRERLIKGGFRPNDLGHSMPSLSTRRVRAKSMNDLPL